MTSQDMISFIGRSAPASPGDAALYARRDFELEPGWRAARLSVTALGVVEPYVNGHRVGDEMLAPGWTAYEHRVMVSTHDVGALLRPGTNTFGGIVGDGWAVGRLGWEGARSLYSDRPALHMALELEYDHGPVRIATDELCRVGSGAVRANSIYDGETFDARMEPHGWSSPGFDDTAWEPATIVEWNSAALQPLTAPPIRRVEELEPLEIRTTAAGAIVVDFGQIVSGWVQIQVDGARGTEVTLRHAEILTPTGELERETNRTAEATDRYILRGGGQERWEPRFTFHGFRYVEVEGWPGELTPDSIRAIVVHSDMRRTGWFEASDPLLSKLHENVVWSMRGNFVGLPTDCPQRDERLGWTGDINAFAPTAAFLYDVRGVLSSWLADLAAEQHAKGSVPWVVPDALRQPSSPTALWSDVAVALPWTLYQHYGDPAVLRDAWPSMLAFGRQVQGLVDEHGVWSDGFQFGDWLDPDAPPSNPAAGKTDRHLVATAFLHRTAIQLSASAELLGHRLEAVEFDELAEQVRAGFHREYVAPSGRLVSESATAYALALVFDLLDPEQRGRAGERLARLVRQRDFLISTGFAGTPLLADALTMTGHLEEAYRLLLQTECPSFLYPVTMGATTVWERWDSVLPDGTLNATGMTSLNHYALGAIADWMHRTIGGLQRTAPGFRAIRIAPRPGGGITSASVSHETKYGRIDVEWSIEGEQISLRVVVPDGIAATIVPPLVEGVDEFEIEPGSHAWTWTLTRPYAALSSFTLDSPLRKLAGDVSAWDAVNEVLQRHVPGVAFDLTAPQVGELTLSSVVEFLPGDGGELQRDLLAALSR